MEKENNENYFWLKHLTGGWPKGYFWLMVKVSFAGKKVRNLMREDLGKRILERGQYAAPIQLDRADDILAEMLGVKEEIVAGARCVTWETD